MRRRRVDQLGGFAGNWLANPLRRCAALIKATVYISAQWRCGYYMPPRWDPDDSCGVGGF